MRKLFTLLLLALLTALLATACQKDEPTPPCRQDTALPRPHYPGNPYPLPYLPDDPTVVPTAYSVDTYLEPDTLVYTFERNALGTEVVLTFDVTSRYTGGRRLALPGRGTSSADSLAYVRQARLRGEDGKPRAHPLRAQTLLMNVTSLRALLYRADGSHTDISDRCTLTYTSFEPYFKSGYTTFYARYASTRWTPTNCGGSNPTSASPATSRPTLPTKVSFCSPRWLTGAPSAGRLLPFSRPLATYTDVAAAPPAPPPRRFPSEPDPSPHVVGLGACERVAAGSGAPPAPRLAPPSGRGSRASGCKLAEALGSRP